MFPISLLSLYQFCPRRVFLDRVMKLSDQPKETVAKEKIKEELFELINKAEFGIVTSIEAHKEKKEIAQLYYSTFTALLKKTIIKHKSLLRMFYLEPSLMFSSLTPILKLEATLRAQNVYKTLQKKIYGYDLWEQLQPKFKSNYTIESNLLKATIDQLAIYEDRIIPILNKPGAPPKEDAWPSHQLEIAACLTILEQLYKMKLKTGYIRYHEHNQLRKITLSPFLRDQVEELTTQITSLIEKKDLPPRLTNENKCNSCPLKGKCFDDNFILEQVENLSINK